MDGSSVEISNDLILAHRCRRGPSTPTRRADARHHVDTRVKPAHDDINEGENPYQDSFSWLPNFPRTAVPQAGEGELAGSLILRRHPIDVNIDRGNIVARRISRRRVRGQFEHAQPILARTRQVAGLPPHIGPFEPGFR